MNLSDESRSNDHRDPTLQPTAKRVTGPSRAAILESWHHPTWFPRPRHSGPFAVYPEMRGWRVVEQSEQTTVWQDDDGDSLSLTLRDGVIGLLELSDRHAVRRHCRELAMSMDSVLVEADIVTGPAGPAVMLVCKRFEKSALTLTGMLFVGGAGRWWVWTVVGCERGTTGMREATVTTQLLNEGKLTLTQFPGHPLSKVRRELRRLIAVTPVVEVTATGSGSAASS